MCASSPTWKWQMAHQNPNQYLSCVPMPTSTSTYDKLTEKIQDKTRYKWSPRKRFRAAMLLQQNHFSAQSLPSLLHVRHKSDLQRPYKQLQLHLHPAASRTLTEQNRTQSSLVFDFSVQVKSALLSLYRRVHTLFRTDWNTLRRWSGRPHWYGYSMGGFFSIVPFILFSTQISSERHLHIKEDVFCLTCWGKNGDCRHIPLEEIIVSCGVDKWDHSPFRRIHGTYTHWSASRIKLKLVADSAPSNTSFSSRSRNSSRVSRRTYYE